VSLELPSASSLRASRSRSGGSSRSTKRRRLGLLPLCLLAAVAALCTVSLLVVRALSRPRIESLEPSIGEAGGEILLRGRNFGRSRGDGRVDLGVATPTSSSYLAWTDEEIRLRLPPSFDSGLLHVVTRYGRSNPGLFMNRAGLPVLAPREAANASGPRVASIYPEEGTIGSLLVVTGSGFGESRGESELRFARAAGTEEPSFPGESSPTLAISPPEAESGYELWSDKEIRARVPDGAVSGPVYLASNRTRSNAVFLRVFESAGTKHYSSRARYSLSQSVGITKIRASGPAELYLWTPLPAESASQRVVTVLEREPEPMVDRYRGTALFRLSDLASTRERSIRQSFLVECFSVEVSIDPARGPLRPQEPPPHMAADSAPDSLVPSSAPAVQELARRILRGERGSWRAARLIWDWLGANLAWTGRHEHARVLDALADKSADSYSYAIIAAALLRAAGLPTLPVAGYLVDTNRRAVRHYWVEVYLYGLGWVPLDPVLGSGASPDGVRAPWAERSRYFGGLDNRHIAFSRGLTVLAALNPDGKRVSKDRRWSFQSFYEESRGALKSYSSFWSDVDVTGMY
jgi:transglutaminase-like putative cysteine protease